MLDVGFSEILLTSVIALVVLGPERLPKVARQVGNWMGRARAMARQLSEQLDREVSADELMKQQAKTAARPPPQAPPPAAQTPPGTTLESNESAAPVEAHTSTAAQVDAYTATAAGVPVTPGAPDAAAPSDAENSALAADDTHWPDGILPASATTPAAMHATDGMSASLTLAADVPPGATPANTNNPPHE
jgi:sec-independent protein translocase protein TatB